MPTATLRDEIEKYGALALKLSKQSLTGYLNCITIDANPQPGPLRQLIDTPWQVNLYQLLIPLFEEAAGLRPYNLDTPRLVFVVMPRGHSKTSTIAQLLNWILCFAKRQVECVAAAADTEQAKILLKRMKAEANQNWWLQDKLHFINYEVRGPTGSLEVLSSDAPTSSGLLSDICVVDELVWHKKPDLFQMLFSGRNKRRTAIYIILSNAGLLGSWQYQIYADAKKDPKSWILHEVPGYSASWLSKEGIDKDKEILPRSLFRRVHENVWCHPDEQDALATREQVEACIDPTLSPTTHGNRQYSYTAALDLGLRKDRAVGTLVHREGDVVVLDQMRVWVPQPGCEVRISDVEDWLTEINRNYHLDRLTLDPWQLENTIQRFEDQIEIERYNFSMQSHMKLAENLRQLFRTGKIKLYPDAGLIVLPDGKKEDLTDEIAALVLEYGKDGKTYRIQHHPGKHDDRAISLAMAALGAVQAPEPIDLNVHHLSLMPQTNGVHDMIEMRFPSIRHIPSIQAYQAVIDYQGMKHYLSEAYKTQSEAAFSVLEFHRLLGLPQLAFEVNPQDVSKNPDNAKERLEQVTKDVQKYIKDQRLEPVKKEPQPQPELVEAGEGRVKLRR